MAKKKQKDGSKLNKFIRRNILAALLLLLTAALLGGCGQKTGGAVSFESTRFLMDTVVTIRLQALPDSGVSREELKEAALAALDRMEEVAAAADRYAPDGSSDLQRLAAAAGSGRLVEVSRDIYRIQQGVLSLGRQAAAAEPLAEGMVDTTLGPLIDLWAEAREELVLPEDQAIKAALALADMSKIRMVENPGEKSSGEKEPEFAMALEEKGMSLDFGAVAKGYGVEAAWQVLKDSGLAISGIIDAGGNIKTLGEKPSGGDWNVGLTDPARPDRLLGAVALKPDMVAATSGDYQRYAEIEGLRYHHLLSPADGRPGRYNHSATAITADGFTADYYSTLLFLLPPENALALAEATAGLETIIVSAEGRIYVSSGLREKMTWSDDLGGLALAEV